MTGEEGFIMNKTISRLGAGLCAAGMLFAALPLTANAADTLPSGISEEQIGAKIEEKVAENAIAGFSTIVFHGDDIIYSGNFGCTDVENNVEVTDESVFEWGSITKTLTWVSIMQLYEQGKLDLEADISTYLPDGYLKHLKYDDPITILNLMNHNAGWADTTYAIFTESGKTPDKLEDAVQQIEPAQVYHPGEVSSYSNFGAALAGVIVEEVSGEDYTEYVRQHIFKPLGMERTSIAADRSDNKWVETHSRQLKGYMVTKNGDKETKQCTVPELGYIAIPPAGAATGTISDLATYAQALADPDAPLFEKPETQELMLTGSIYHGDSDIPICCHGFWPQEGAVRIYGHDGGTLACSTDMVFDPITGYGCVTCANSRSSTPLVYGVPGLVFGETDPASYPTSDEECPDMSGIYSLSRTTSKGLLRFAGSLSMMILPKPDEEGKYVLSEDIDVTPLGGDLFLLRQEEMYTVGSIHTLSNGKQAICLGSMELIRDGFAPVRLVILALYAILSIVCIVRLIIKIVQIARKKRFRYPGSISNSFAQIMLPISVGAAIAALLTASDCIHLTPLLGLVFGVIQMLCVLVYVLAGVMSIIFLCSKRMDKGKTGRYIMNIAGSAFCTFVVIYFEMYQFWGC